MNKTTNLSINFKFITILFSLILFFNSCKFDKECYYGCLFGNCLDGTCYCDEGWTGVDCRIQKTPTSIKIYRIDILNFPQFNSNGSPWDVGSNPDVYVLFRQESIVMYNQLSSSQNFCFTNAINTNTYTVYPQDSITITNLNADYNVSLIEYDETTADVYMGGIAFEIYNDRNEFPHTLVYTTDNISFRIYLSYKWN